jgi:hypothetical protein
VPYTTYWYNDDHSYYSSSLGHNFAGYVSAATVTLLVQVLPLALSRSSHRTSCTPCVNAFGHPGII